MSTSRTAANHLTRVSALGFGGAPIGNLYSEVPEVTAITAVTEAARSGIRYFDTAPYYGHGLSEERLGRAFASQHLGPIVVSTKVGRVVESTSGSAFDIDGFAVSGRHCVFDYSASGVLRSFDGSLNRLRRDHVDILFLHDVDQQTHGSLHAARFRQALDEALPEMAKLKASGACHAIGIGVNDEQSCLDVIQRFDLDCILLAGRYTLLEQDHSLRILAECLRRGISIYIGGPFNSGLLARAAAPGTTYNYRAVPPNVLVRARKIYEICASYSVDVGAAALQFPLAHPAVKSVVAGFRSSAEVAAAIERMGAPLPAALWDTFRDEGIIAPEAFTP